MFGSCVQNSIWKPSSHAPLPHHSMWLIDRGAFSVKSSQQTESPSRLLPLPLGSCQSCDQRAEPPPLTGGWETRTDAAARLGSTRTVMTLHSERMFRLPIVPTIGHAPLGNRRASDRFSTIIHLP